MDVVIVESPAKAKTINKYLGPGYEVLASYGHVRDLPPKDGSVRPDDDFAMDWEVDAKSKKRLSDIAEAVKRADRVILATDPDREGEAISWHVLQVLKDKKVLRDKPVDRVVFNAVTRQAVQEAMRHPRSVDEPLVDAYLARRALDYLVGFTLSPVLWRKLPGAKSAGRVQSVALRLVCDREAEIERFRPQEYWSVVARLRTPRNEAFTARLTGLNGRKLDRLSIGNGDDAGAAKRQLEASTFTVASVESKPQKRNPQPPFTTSTLQQEAQRKLGFDASRTMRIAQRLYEGVEIGGETAGLITYMRTDGVDMAPEALGAARSVIEREYGAHYLPDAPRRYHAKAKNAQEAHEAIRPTDMSRLPGDVVRFLDHDQARLYELIWKRTVASQMAAAEMERTTIEIDARAPDGTAALRATGSVIRFDGFLTLYQEGRDDEEDEEGGRLPAVTAGERLERDKIEAEQHFTEPPPRYTEASLIKRMEELGIGRPSTYAQTMETLRKRDYVRFDRKRLVPEDRGRIVIAFLEDFFGRYVEYDFTADLEEKLDRISAGELSWKDVLRDFWRDFSATVAKVGEIGRTEVIDALNLMLGDHLFPARADGGDPRVCQVCGTGRAFAETRKIRGLHRLLELSRVPLHASAWRERRRRCLRVGGWRGPWQRSRNGTCRHVTDRPLRPVCSARAGRREGRREAEAREHPQGLVGRGAGPFRGASAPLPSPPRRDTPGERKAYRCRHRPLRPLRGARRQIRQSRQRRRSLLGWREPCRRASCRQAEPRQPIAAGRLGAEGARGTPRARRTDHGAGWPLWTIRESRQGQCHAAQEHGAPGRDAGPGRRPARREGRTTGPQGRRTRSSPPHACLEGEAKGLRRSQIELAA